MEELTFVLGRVIFGGYFVFNAYRHFTQIPSLTGYTRFRGVPAPAAAVIITGFILLFGGLSIILGIRPMGGIGLLLLFLIPVTITMHPFWDEADSQKRTAEAIGFYKNVALIGALLVMFAIAQPWPYSLAGFF